MPPSLDLTHARYPRSNGYDAQWVVDNQMGPHPLWQLEALLEVMDLRPGTRVLDLGCGTALTSIFLAREFGARVIAADLWIDPSENLARIREAGVDDLVEPLKVDARVDHPYATDAFDVIVSIDAYQYFGTGDLVLAHVLRYLKAGGQLGITVPSVPDDFGPDLPAGLQEHWNPDFCSFHSPQWWREHWERTRLVSVVAADDIVDAATDWARFERACLAHATDEWRRELATEDLALLEADVEHQIGFARIAATKS